MILHIFLHLHDTVQNYFVTVHLHGNYRPQIRILRFWLYIFCLLHIHFFLLGVQNCFGLKTLKVLQYVSNHQADTPNKKKNIILNKCLKESFKGRTEESVYIKLIYI